MLIVFGLVTAVVGGLVGGTVGFAVGASSVKTSGDLSDIRGSGLGVDGSDVARVDCGSLRCLNRELTQLDAFVKQFYDCIRVFPVTQYPYGGASGGYQYEQPGGATVDTTALDYSESLDHPLRWMATFKNTNQCVTDPA